jgi:hypothetical protein
MNEYSKFSQKNFDSHKLKLKLSTNNWNIDSWWHVKYGKKNINDNGKNKI